VADTPDQRFNDGQCDPAGRFWVGTKVEGGRTGAGRLYCLDRDLKVTPKLDGVSISNGLVWSGDASRFYYIDTPTQAVVGYDYDQTRGSIENRTLVAKLPEGVGAPDGMTIEADDHLWVALFHGGAVWRIDPSTGKAVFRVELPVSNVTSCAFGGAELDELYITTASVGLDDAQRAAQPLAGSLFVAKVPFRGVAAWRFGRALTA
jgi:sugar lactone lactonase YvrE